SAQIREILINESAWEEMTCLFALSLNLVILDKTEANTQPIVYIGFYIISTSECLNVFRE
ncbi:hypothetical protein NXG49_29150, partial [Klebsiella pneumoniae]|nr:hypothetical protein [Klebsiella pneumoniae]